MRAVLLLVFFFTVQIVFANAALTNDTVPVLTSQHSQEPPQESALYVAALGTLLMLYVLAFLTVVILALLSFGVIFAGIAGLLFAGILSASILTSLHKRSVLPGFKLFLLLSNVFVCAIGTSITFFLGNKIMHWFSTEAALFGGLVCGALAGVLVGWIEFRLLKRLLMKLQVHFQ